MASRNQMALPLTAVVLLLTASTVHGSGLGSSQLEKAGRIGDGQIASIEEFPWMVSLEEQDNRFSVCGGTVLSELWVLTAAQCFVALDNPVVRSSTNLKSEGGLLHKIKNVVMHERIKVYPTTDYDIGFIKMETPFVWTKQLQPVRGLATENPAVGTKVVLIGWGAVANGTQQMASVHKLSMVVRDGAECKNTGDAREDGEVNERKICAFQPGKALCQGDGGDPLIEEETGLLVGVVSVFGDMCTSYEPGLYTSVASFREWIRQKTSV